MPFNREHNIDKGNNPLGFEPKPVKVWRIWNSNGASTSGSISGSSQATYFGQLSQSCFSSTLKPIFLSQTSWEASRESRLCQPMAEQQKPTVEELKSTNPPCNIKDQLQMVVMLKGNHNCIPTHKWRWI